MILLDFFCFMELLIYSSDNCIIFLGLAFLGAGTALALGLAAGVFLGFLSLTTGVSGSDSPESLPESLESESLEPLDSDSLDPLESLESDESLA